MYAKWRADRQQQLNGHAKSEMDANTKALTKTLAEAQHAGKVKSLMSKHLSEEEAQKLGRKSTKHGGTLGDCIKSGVDNLDSGCGIYACDAEAYRTFFSVFDGVIRDYHHVPKRMATVRHPAPDFGDIDNLDFDDLDPSGKYIVSTRVRVGRSVDGYSFPPIITNQQRLDLEEQGKKALGSLTGELKGTYHALTGMTEDVRQTLVNDHFLFKDDDRFLRDAGGYKDWPNGRGIYYNENKTFLVWLNEEDHFRIISMQQGGNLGEVYSRLVKAVRQIEKLAPFALDQDLGYLTFCPTNLGTALRASVHMRIPNVSKLATFKEICTTLHIQPRGIHGEHTESVGGVFDLSNKRRLGITEYQAIKEMAQGVQVLLLLEKSLELIQK